MFKSKMGGFPHKIFLCLVLRDRIHFTIYSIAGIENFKKPQFLWWKITGPQ